MVYALRIRVLKSRFRLVVPHKFRVKKRLGTPGMLNLDLRLVLQEGEITDVYALQRDAGMFKFPCFGINRPVNHGFSGAPVFWMADYVDRQWWV